MPTSQRFHFPLDYVPAATRPYLELIRLDKPTGIWLVFWSYAWGLTMGAFHESVSISQFVRQFASTFAIAFLMRSIACTINDICDIEFDKAVERTRKRPLPSGRISYGTACAYAIAQLVVDLAVFATLLNTPAFIAAAIQLVTLSFVYPLMKRITYWPQSFLGISINLGAIVSWLSVTNDTNPWLMASLLTSLWSWTILYDTVYACQDMKDDLKCGVRSTAILFGDWIRPLLTAFGLTFVSSLAYAGYLNQQGQAFYLISIGGTVLHLIWQYLTVDLEDPASCKLNFIRNGQLGWVVWAGCAVDYLTKTRLLI